MSDKLYKIPVTNVSGSIKGVTSISSGSPLNKNNIATNESAYKFNLTGLYKFDFKPSLFCFIQYNVEETNEFITHNIYIPENSSLNYKEGIMLFKVFFENIEMVFDKKVNSVVAKATIFDTITIDNDTFRIHLDKDYTPTNATNNNTSPIDGFVS